MIHMLKKVLVCTALVYEVDKDGGSLSHPDDDSLGAFPAGN